MYVLALIVIGLLVLEHSQFSWAIMSNKIYLAAFIIAIFTTAVVAQTPTPTPPDKAGLAFRAVTLLRATLTSERAKPNQS